MVSILGIDPGLARFGWSGINLEEGEVSLGLCGLISHPRDTAVPFNEYMDTGIAQIADQFPVLLSLVQPHVIYAEYVPPGRLGSRSELVVAAITTAKTIAYQWGIEWHGIASSSWKKLLVDDASATKARVRNHLLESFPSLQEKHASQKEEQKKLGETVTGIPQDVFDSIGIGIAGSILYDTNGNKS